MSKSAQQYLRNQSIIHVSLYSTKNKGIQSLCASIEQRSLKGAVETLEKTDLGRKSIHNLGPAAEKLSLNLLCVQVTIKSRTSVCTDQHPRAGDGATPASD